MPEPHGFVVRLALGTGLRWGELTRAQASDVEGGMLVVSQTKSGKVRRVPLAPELLREVRGRVGRLVGYSWKSPGSFAKAVRKATGIEGFHVHQLRHTFACQWIERGGSLAALQQILGHASVVTTQRYARLSDEAVRREAETARRRCLVRAIGLALVVLGYLWLVQDSRIVRRNRYPATVLPIEELARDSTRAVSLQTASDAVSRAVDVALDGIPNPLWPGSTMLAGGLLIWLGRRREARPGIL